MWQVEKTEIESGVNQYRIRRGPNYLSYGDWIELLKSSTAFVEFYVALLKASQYAAYFWEVKPLDEKSVAEPFEFVLVESSSLPGIKANPSAFSEHFKQEELVVTFPNLVTKINSSILILVNFLSD